MRRIHSKRADNQLHAAQIASAAARRARVGQGGRNYVNKSRHAPGVRSAARVICWLGVS